MNIEITHYNDFICTGTNSDRNSENYGSNSENGPGGRYTVTSRTASFNFPVWMKKNGEWVLGELEAIANPLN